MRAPTFPKLFISLAASSVCIGGRDLDANLWGSATQIQQTCSMETLGRALAVDTAGLRKHHREGPSPGTSEGMSLTVFSFGRTPRVIHASYMGETGRLDLRYYLLDSASFVVDRDEVRYARPITKSHARVASRIRNFAYYCDGKLLSDAYLGATRDLRPTLDTLLQSLQRKKQPL